MGIDLKRRERLAREIQRAIKRADGTRMIWGRNDCALWVGNILRAALYYDPVLSFRGKYRNAFGAARLLGRGGLSEALQNTAETWGWERRNSKHCEPGDVGLVMTESGPACVVCYSSGYWVGRVDYGWTMVKDRGENIYFCWKVC